MCDGDQSRDTESDNINTIVSYDHDPEDAISLRHKSALRRPPARYYNWRRGSSNSSNGSPNSWLHGCL